MLSEHQDRLTQATLPQSRDINVKIDVTAYYLDVSTPWVDFRISADMRNFPVRSHSRRDRTRYFRRRTVQNFLPLRRVTAGLNLTWKQRKIPVKWSVKARSTVRVRSRMHAFLGWSAIAAPALPLHRSPKIIFQLQTIKSTYNVRSAPFQKKFHTVM